jgi:P-type Ca2+ transporter type 2C
VPLVWGPDEPSVDVGTTSMTMTFVVMGLGTTFNALVNRRDPTSGLTPPIAKALAIALVPVGMLFLATQLPTLQAGLLTVALTGEQWLVCAGLAAILPIVVEGGKLLRRRRTHGPELISPQVAVEPARARAIRPVEPRASEHVDG